MLGLKYWRFVYGAIYVCASTAFIIMLVLNAPSIATKAMSQFDLEWAFGSWSKLTMGLIPLIGLWALLALLERRFPAGAVKPASGWFLNLKLILFSFVLQPLLNVLLGVFLGYISSALGTGLIDLRLTPGTGIGRAVMAFLIWFFMSDFFFYWEHRFQHESFLWQLHKVHHLDEHVSAITAHRGHWLDGFFYYPVVIVPTALLFKFDPLTGGTALGVISLFTVIWQTFFHANLKVGFGGASPLFVSPQLHRIHHSRLPEHRDKNFAGYFPILDVVFGTYYHPRSNEYPPTGVHDEEDVRSFRESLFLPIRGWWRMFREWRSRHAITPGW